MVIYEGPIRNLVSKAKQSYNTIMGKSNHNYDMETYSESEAQKLLSGTVLAPYADKFGKGSYEVTYDPNTNYLKLDFSAKRVPNDLVNDVRPGSGKLYKYVTNYDKGHAIVTMELPVDKDTMQSVYNDDNTEDAESKDTMNPDAGVSQEDEESAEMTGESMMTPTQLTVTGKRTLQCDDEGHEILKDKVLDEGMIIREAYYTELKSKSVYDADGFTTEYTLYKSDDPEYPYVCIFGDRELYTPDNTDPDMEFESEDEANEWFNDYEGPGYDTEEFNDDYYEDFDEGLEVEEGIKLEYYHDSLEYLDDLGLEPEDLEWELINSREVEGEPDSEPVGYDYGRDEIIYKEYETTDYIELWHDLTNDHYVGLIFDEEPDTTENYPDTYYAESTRDFGSDLNKANKWLKSFKAPYDPYYYIEEDYWFGGDGKLDDQNNPTNPFETKETETEVQDKIDQDKLDLLDKVVDDMDDKLSDGELKESISRKFVELEDFTRDWKDLNLTDEDLQDLQSLILKGEGWIPLGAEVYKIRFSPKSLNKGKDTALRSVFIDIIDAGTIYLVKAFTKSEQQNLDNQELKDIKQVSKDLKEN